MKSLIDVIKRSVSEPRNDRMLHFSTDLQNPRHTAVAWKHNVPHVLKPWANTFPLMQGTAVHEEIHRIMMKQNDWKYAGEQTIMVEDGFKYPWGGTADAYVETPEGEVWLLDYKTISGASMSFLSGEPKPEHVLQLSAYYHYGVTLPNLRCGIMYFPTSTDYKRRWHEPEFYEVTPLPLDMLNELMYYVEDAIGAYMEDDDLPAVPAPSLKWKHNKKEKVWERWSTPHYSSMFCPWKGQDDDPCGCSKRKAEIIDTSETDPTESV